MFLKERKFQEKGVVMLNAIKMFALNLKSNYLYGEDVTFKEVNSFVCKVFKLSLLSSSLAAVEADELE